MNMRVCVLVSLFSMCAAFAAGSTAAAEAYRFRTTGVAIDAEWTQRFRFPANPGWQGTDSTYSIPLSGFRRLGANWTAPAWSLFSGGDTFVGWLNNDTPRTRWAYVFAPNTLSLFNGQGSAALGSQYFKWKGLPFSDSNFLFQDREAVAMVRGRDGYVRWPADGSVVNHGLGGTWLVQFWSVVDTASLQVMGVDVATWVTAPPNPSTTHPYNGAAGGTWNITLATNNWLARSGSYTSNRYMGNAVLNLATGLDAFVSDGFVYVYGVQEAGDAAKKRVFVARTVPTALHDPSRWSYWTGSTDAQGMPTFPTQANSIAAAAPLVDTGGNIIQGLAAEFSVFQLPNGHFAMLYTEGDGQATYTPGVAVPVSPVRVLVRTTKGSKPSPAGPWSAPTAIYTVDVPKTGNPDLGLPDLTAAGFTKDVYWTYGAKAHPQYSKPQLNAVDGELLVSFNINSWGGLSAFNLADVYRPRFIRVKFYKVANQEQ